MLILFIYIHLGLYLYLLFLRLRVTQNALQLPFYSFYLFLFRMPCAVFEWTVKSLLSVFNLSLPKTRVASIGPVSLGTLANVFVLVLLTVISDAGDQYLFNMHVEFSQNCLGYLN